MNPITLHEIATSVLTHLEAAYPQLPPTQVELVLARAARLHRERTPKRPQHERTPTEHRAISSAATDQVEADESRAEASARRVSASIVSTAEKKGHTSDFPKLREKLVAYLEKHPDAFAIEGYRHLEKVYGKGFIKYDYFRKKYWKPLTAKLRDE